MVFNYYELCAEYCGHGQRMLFLLLFKAVRKRIVITRAAAVSKRIYRQICYTQARTPTRHTRPQQYDLRLTIT